MRSNNFRCKRIGFLGYFATTSLKTNHFKETFESATSNLSVLDKILVCILRGFNFANGHFSKYSRGLIFAKGPTNLRNDEILSAQKFIHLR